MKILADNEFGFGSLMVGFSLLCALIFYYFAVLRLDYRKTELLDLGPYPDAVEYFAQAKAMLKGGWPSIQIRYDKLPSRYPFGYPVLMLPWLKILSNADSLLAPFRTNQTDRDSTSDRHRQIGIKSKHGQEQKQTNCAAVAIVFLLAASPVLLINTIEFHSPFKTGYDFWVPYWSEHLLFSPRYIPSNLDRLCREIALGPEGYHAANIFGTGTSFVSGFVLLTITGLFLIRISRSLLSGFLAGLSYLTSILSHNSQLVDARYYLPLFVLSVALAALPVTWAVKNVFVGKRIIASLLIFVMFAATCFGYPSRSGHNTVGINRSQTWDALHFADHPRRYRRQNLSRAHKGRHFAAQKDFAELVGSYPGIVLSSIDPVYLNALLPDGFVAAPLDGDHNYRFSKIWHYDRPEALALVERGLGRGLPIYALFVPIKEKTTQQSRLPALPGYKWTISNNSSGNALVLQLSPIEY